MWSTFVMSRKRDEYDTTEQVWYADNDTRKGCISAQVFRIFARGGNKDEVGELSPGKCYTRATY